MWFINDNNSLWISVLTSRIYMYEPQKPHMKNGNTVISWTIYGVLHSFALQYCRTHFSWAYSECWLCKRFLLFVRGIGVSFEETFLSTGRDTIFSKCNAGSSQWAFSWPSSVVSVHFGYSWSWPAYPSDLNPCGLFLEVFFKDTVFRNNPFTIQKMKQWISAAMISISEHPLSGVQKIFQK
jgi:hypothetical protein